MLKITDQSGWLHFCRLHCADWRIRVLATCIMLLITSCLFGSRLTTAAECWLEEPQYYYCLLVPMTSTFFVWRKRDQLLRIRPRYCLAGLALFAAGSGCSQAGIQSKAEILQSIGVLISLCGTVLLIWGRHLFDQLWPALLYLGFLLPLPRSLEAVFSVPMQEFGAREAAWYLQTCGIPAYAFGSEILLAETQLDVGTIFSGLRMLMAYLSLTSAAAMFSNRVLWERIVILWSALPIAAICSVFQLTATAMAQHCSESQQSESQYAAISNWLMLPLAILVLYTGISLFDWMFTEVEQQSPEVCITRSMPRAVPGSGS